MVATLFQLSVFGLYLCSRFSPRHQLYIVATTLSFVLFVNLVYVFALPSVGRHVGDVFDGAWRGFYTNKNQFAGVMVWSMVVYYLLSFRNPDRFSRMLARVGLLVGPMVVILSTSKTALIVSLAVCPALLLWRKYRWQGRKSILTFDFLLLLSLFSAVGIIGNWVTIVSDILGKDPTLTGRTTIWKTALELMSRRPLTGYGFSAFWDEENPLAREIGDALHPGFYTHTAHNGFIDVVLSLGWVGLAIFLGVFLYAWWMALKYAYRPTGPEHSWPLAVMLMLTLSNLTESTFLGPSLDWFFFVLAFLSMRIWPRQRSLGLRQRLAPLSSRTRAGGGASEADSVSDNVSAQASAQVIR